LVLEFGSSIQFKPTPKEKMIEWQTLSIYLS